MRKRLSPKLNILPMLLIMGLFLLTPASAQAFDAGRIIDDGVFTDKNSMNAGDIQNFLNSKVGTCDTWHSPGSGSQGEQPPWTCLKNYSEGGRSAAQIIYDTAQQYGISPKVLLVTLQKENGLVTDTWPYRWQYRTAMGMGCPDGAPCDSQYFGFTNQMSQGARHLMGFFNQNAGWYIPYRPGVNYIKWHPNGACGGTNVNIQNRATAALYSYTPYQPNQAALNAGFGTGDGCSSYGNRNFYNYFVSWFGSTYSQAYEYSNVWASEAPVHLDAGQEKDVHIVIRNTGYATWYADGDTPAAGTVRLATHNYDNSGFAVVGQGWLTPNQIRMKEAVVAPGENATFSFRVAAPYSTFKQQHRFYLLWNGYFMSNKTNIDFHSWKPGYQFIGSTSFNTYMLGNSTGSSTITLKNTGGSTWYGDGSVPAGKQPTRLATLGYEDSPFADTTNSSWLNTRNQVKMNEAAVPPGQNGTFTANFIGPLNQAERPFNFRPIFGGIFSEWYGTSFNLKSPPRDLNYEIVGATNPPATMSPGQIANVQIRLRNTGNVVWKDENFRSLTRSMRLGMIAPQYRNSPFYNSADPAWLGGGQIKMTSASVAPGEIGDFNFTWKAPSTPGFYWERFSGLNDGVFMRDLGMTFATTVQ